jgi:capsular exopolysaccharide synthesis family protein
MMRPAAISPPPAGMTPGDIMRILRKRMWIIILSTLIMSALAAVGTFLWLRFSPSYTAQAYLQVDAPKSDALTSTTFMYPKEIMDRIKMTHAKMVTNENVLTDAAKQDDLRQTAWFARQKDPVRSLSKEISVSPIAETNFIQVSMTGPERTELPIIVNAVAKAYVDYASDTRRRSNEGEAGRIMAKKTELEAQLDKTRQEAAIAKRDMGNLRGSVSAADLDVQEKHAQRGLAEREYRQAKIQLDNLTDAEKNGKIGDSKDVQEALQFDAQLRSMEAQRSQMASRRDTVQQKFGPESLQLQEYKRSLDALDREIGTRRKEVADMAINAARVKAQDAANQASNVLDQVTDAYKEALAAQKEAQAKLGTLDGLAVSEQHLLEQIKKCEDRMLELGLLAGGSSHDVWLTAQADLPKEPSMPRWAVMMPAGVFLGLMLGLGLAFLLELTDSSIKSPSDIARKVDLPMLGMVPHLEDLDEEIEDLRLSFRTNPNSLVSEAFRQIHTCMLFSGAANQRRTILVASATPEDGRTTVAANLAATAARAGRKVLLVDTNFRQAMIRQLFPLCNERGLSDALVGQYAWRDLVSQAEPGLFVMSAGTLPPNPAELLGSESMRATIAEMIAEYDQIIFDAAPCLVVTDAIVLSTMVDGVVLVIRAGVNTHGIVQRARDTLNRVGARILGVVLNGVRATPGGYLRKHYESFYDYREKAQLDTEATATDEAPPAEGQEPEEPAPVGARGSDEQA